MGVCFTTVRSINRINKNKRGFEIIINKIGGLEISIFQIGSLETLKFPDRGREIFILFFRKVTSPLPVIMDTPRYVIVSKRPMKFVTLGMLTDIMIYKNYV